MGKLWMLPQFRTYELERLNCHVGEYFHLLSPVCAAGKMSRIDMHVKFYKSNTEIGFRFEFSSKLDALLHDTYINC